MDSDVKNKDAEISEAISAIAKDLSVFVNLLTDFGFKRVFGIKEVMLDFLNTVLDIEGGIADLTYSNVEIPGLTKEDRKAIFDLICITGKNERIIVEMQTIEQEHYKDRMLTYASQLIQEQNVKGKVGNKDWNFKLYPVYSVNILKFCLNKNVKTRKFLSYVQLMDRKTREVFTDKLTFVCIELPRFGKKLKNVKTGLEQWVYLIKHLHEMKGVPEKLKNEVFEKIFEMAKIAKMNKKEVYKYIKSLNEMNIVQNEINRRDRAIAQVSAERDTAWAERDSAWNTVATVTAERDNAWAERDNAWNALAQKNKEIAEYRRLLGLN